VQQASQLLQATSKKPSTEIETGVGCVQEGQGRMGFIVYQLNESYNNAATTGGFTHAQIIDFYRRIMTETIRICRVGGLILVKTQDMIESSKQHHGGRQTDADGA
jgi:hypothetical protein